MELTPRTAPPPSDTTPPRRRSLWAYGILAVVLIAVGVVAYQGLTSASLYFYNADEAVAQKADLGDKRFRLQGTVVGDPDAQGDGQVDFTIAYNGQSVAVVHHGDPPELFKTGIPVVLEGHWNQADDVYESDRIIVKHSEEYEADHPDRVKADDGASTSSTTP